MTDDELYKLFGKTEMHEIPARDLGVGDVIRIELPKFAGQGFAYLEVESVDCSDPDSVAVSVGEGRAVLSYRSSEPSHRLVHPDEIDMADITMDHAFAPDELVTIEIIPTAA